VYAKVAIPKSAPEALTYSVPDDLEAFAVPGVRVRVPLRQRTATGVLVEITDTTDLAPASVRPLTEVVDPECCHHIFSFSPISSPPTTGARSAIRWRPSSPQASCDQTARSPV